MIYGKVYKYIYQKSGQNWPKINEIKHFEVILKRKIIFILSSDEEDLDEEVSVVNLLCTLQRADTDTQVNH